MSALVVGVDPGPIPGVVILCLVDGRLSPNPAVFQCDARSVAWLVEQLLGDDPTFGPPPYQQQILAVERFVVGPRAARSSTPTGGRLTRNMVGELAALGRQLGVRVVQRSASEVMPWANDARLDRAALLAPTKGMQHARAAARHALFCAVRDAGAPDPLSAKVRGA